MKKHKSKCVDDNSPELYNKFSRVLNWIFSKSGIIPLAVEHFLAMLPAAVIGPAISLIGLDLSDSAIVDAGFRPDSETIDPKTIIVSMVTLAVIILFSLFKRRFCKNIAIILGMIAGYIVYVLFNGFPDINAAAMFDLSCPDFSFPLKTLPPNWPQLLISIIPSTLVVFTENIGRITVINRMKDENVDAKLFDKKSVINIGRAVLSHGFASLSSALLGSVPNTIYAENIAIMGIHRNKKGRKDPCEFVNKLTDPFSSAPYLIAAAFAIIFSFSDALQNIIQNIPKPVIGGMELFLFGIISAPGIQLLVDQRVDYKKISNQIITASVLLTGISELCIKSSWFELKGMSLGLVVGFVLNFFVIFLKWLGVLCDPLTMDEVTISCLSVLSKEGKSAIINIPDAPNNTKIPEIKELISYLEGYGKDQVSEYWHDTVALAGEINLLKTDGTPLVRIVKRENSLCVDICKDALSESLVTAYLNDYSDAVDIDVIRQDSQELSGADFLVIDLSRNIPLRKVETLIKQIEW